jgi:hypothetical protein
MKHYDEYLCVPTLDAYTLTLLCQRGEKKWGGTWKPTDIHRVTAEWETPMPATLHETLQLWVREEARRLAAVTRTAHTRTNTPPSEDA